MKVEKNIFIIITFLSVVLGCSSISRSGGTVSSIDDFVINGSVLERYLGNADRVIIPANLGILTIGDNAFKNATAKTITIPNGVVIIGEEAFSMCRDLVRITIPNSVTSIGNGAFAYCYNLTEINLPRNLTIIGEELFYYCTGLVKITIPNSITSISDYAFGYCRSLTNINIPSSVTSIGNYAFENCKNLTTLNFNYGIITIGDGAFSGCSNLSRISIPNSVTSIGNLAFDYCENLTNIIIPSSVSSIGGFVFRGCSSLAWISVDMQNNDFTSVDGVLYDNEKNILIRYPPAKREPDIIIPDRYIIPNGVTLIGEGAFSDCNYLRYLYIPVSVETIHNNAFSDCNSLVLFTVDEENTKYSSLDGVLYSKNKTVLIRYPAAKRGAFVIPDGVIIIQGDAFENCIFTKITIPASVEHIGVTEIDMLFALLMGPSSLENYRNEFIKCPNLSEIVVDEQNINFSSEDGVLYNKTKTVLISYPPAKEDEIFVVPNNVTSIVWAAFGFTHIRTNLMTLVLTKNVRFSNFFLENIEIKYSD